MPIKQDMKSKKRDINLKEKTDNEDITEISHKKVKNKREMNAVSDLGDQKQEATTNEEIIKENGMSIQTIKQVDGNIFDFFTLLTKSEGDKQLLTINQLLQHLKHSKQEEEKHHKELKYCLKRLIRGCGAGNNKSRSSFYTALVAFLKYFKDDGELKMSHCFDIMQKELHVGNALNNKEDADAVVGRILMCGALLRSGHLLANLENNALLEQWLQVLTKSMQYRSYHVGLAYQFFCDLLDQLTEQENQDQFDKVIWPSLRTVLEQPWPKQSTYSVHCILKIKQKFPKMFSKKYMKYHFGGSHLLNEESFPYLYKIFWQHTNLDILTQPALEMFGKYLASAKHLYEFWGSEVDKGLEKPTKLMELITLKILTDVMENVDIQQQKACISELLSDNFIHMLVQGLKNLKQSKKDHDTVAAFYHDFLQALVQCCTKLTDDNEKVKIIKRLILPPGIFSIEKFCGQRVVHQLINTLQKEGIQQIFALYKSIFLAEIPKNPDNLQEKWLNFERMNAGYMLQHLLQHKAAQAAYEWREEQLKFLLICGFAYVTDQGEPCRKDLSGHFSKDFGDQCKNMFYNSLQGKIHNLQNEYHLLRNLQLYCDAAILRKCAHDNGKYFKLKSMEIVKIQTAWNKVKETLSGGEGNKKKKEPLDNNEENEVIIVFKILMTNMALQALREPDIAVPAILDLIKCMERVHKKKQHQHQHQHQHQTLNGSAEMEPEWIEVVVDLFLHLLSQNNNSLRTVINALFPHLCQNLQLTAVHQILSVLNMKDNYNPLTTKAEAEEEEEEQENDVNQDDNAEEESTDKEEEEEEDNEDSSDGDTSEGESDEEDAEDENVVDNDEEELITASDKLRNAISQALIENGAAITNGHGSGDGDGDDDDDMHSIDLNDLSEEQGKQLDEALSKAFRAMKKSSSSSTLQKNKKTKNQRIQTTTVMHFRIRVLDLLDIYVQHRPPLLIVVEIMQQLYEMLPYCGTSSSTTAGDNLKPLQQRVEKLLHKITAMKNYHQEVKEDLTEEDFVNFIRLILQQKTPVLLYDVVNRMRNKCVIFLIMNSPLVDATNNIKHINNSKMILQLKEYVQEFITSRNPVINVTLIMDIFKLRWLGVWPLAEYLVSAELLALETRTFRRIQIYEILSILYKNNELQKLNEELMGKCFKKLHKSLQQHVISLSHATTTGELNHSTREFVTLLELMLTINKACERVGMNCELFTQDLFNALRHIRIGVELNSLPAYRRFCQTFQLPSLDKDSPLSSQIDDKEGNAHNSNCLSETEANHKRKQLSTKEFRNMKKLKKQNDEMSSLKQNQTKPVNVHVEVTNGIEMQESSSQETEKSAKRSSSSAKDSRKMKKLKKQERLELASKGLSDHLSFSNVNDNGHNV